jgi:N-formylglutamate amidohydrolase
MPAVSSVISDEGPGRPRADFVLGDRDGTTCDSAFTQEVAQSLRGMGYDVKINDPYKGVELVRAFSDPAAGRHSLQIEVNRRLYMDERTREKSGGFAKLQGDLTRLLEHVAHFASAHSSHRCEEEHHHHHGDHHHHAHDHRHDH